MEIPKFLTFLEVQKRNGFPLGKGLGERITTTHTLQRRVAPEKNGFPLWSVNNYTQRWTGLGPGLQKSYWTWIKPPLKWEDAVLSVIFRFCFSYFFVGGGVRGARENE